MIDKIIYKKYCNRSPVIKIFYNNLKLHVLVKCNNLKMRKGNIYLYDENGHTYQCSKFKSQVSINFGPDDSKFT